MAHFHGTFEGKKVTAIEFRKLQKIRTEEANRIEYYQTEFEMQIEELEYWRQDEKADLLDDFSEAIDDLDREIDEADDKIYQIAQDLSDSLDVIDEYFPTPSSNKTYQINFVIALAQRLEDDQYDIIYDCEQEISDLAYSLRGDLDDIEEEYNTEYNYQLRRREEDTKWAHTYATEQIEEILAHYYRPYHHGTKDEVILVLRCARNPCDFCAAKYGTTGTYAQLEAMECIPPFHDDCRCWLEVVPSP